jgi:hypothetical protein
MKKTFTLIIASFIVVSLIGQTAKLSIQEHKKLRGIEAFEHRTTKGLDLEKLQPAIHHAKPQTTLKSAETLKQRLDSVVNQKFDSSGKWINSSKELYTYDSKGNETSESYYEWDIAISKWAGTEKGEFTWDSNGNITLNIWFDWDLTTKKWVGKSKTENSYDTKGNSTIQISYEWDKNANKWVGKGKTEYTYNSNGNATAEIRSDWDVATSKWVGWMKYERTFNSGGNKTLEICSYTSSPGIWYVSYKSESTYDSKGNLTVQLNSNWYEQDKKWVANFKYEHSYDSRGNETLYASYQWDIAANKWIGSYKDENTFDSNGNVIINISYDWDIYTDKWVINYKDESTIDSNGNLSLMTSYERDKTTGILVLSDKTEVSWNNSFTDFILPEDYMEISFFKHMLTGYIGYTWDSGSSQWKSFEKSAFYYTGQNITGIQENRTSSVSIYPNPATDFLIINLKDVSKPAVIELFDIQGKKMISTLLPINSQISVSQLKSGMYLYTVNQNSEIHNGKIMIK